MIRIVTTEFIAAPPANVWAFISDVQRYPEWIVGTEKILSVSTQKIGAGTEYGEVTKIGRSTSESTWLITAFDAPHSQTHISRSATLDGALTMIVEPERSGTQITHMVEASLLPRMRLLGWPLERLMRRQLVDSMRQTFRQAKRIIELEYGLESSTPSQLHIEQVLAV